MMLNPRSAFSNWREETPRSSSAPPTPVMSKFVEHLARPRESSPAASVTRPPNCASRSPAKAIASGILVEAENVRSGLQNRLGMTAPAAGSIHDQRARTRRKQLDHFRDEHRTVISEILHFLRLLFDDQRTSREPDRTFE